MASSSLRKIFQSDEEKIANLSDDGSDADSEDDEEAQAREAAFNRVKQSSKSTETLSGSIRRYDEYGNFMTRSQRTRLERVNEQESAAKGTDGLKVPSGKNHRVSFAEKEVVIEVPSLTEEDKKNCFMGSETWASIDNDIELTSKRWTNHVEGKIPFDEDNNTIRGIEDLILRLNKTKPITQHRKTILEEVFRQKTSKEYPNWTKLSTISEKSSAAERRKAVDLAKEDEQEKKRIWEPKRPEAPKVAVSTKTKKKKGFFGLFKKK